MNKIKYLVFILCMFVLNISIISANTIDRIDITVKLDENGNGKITEVWSMKVDKGTEVYKTMGDLGNSTLTNFTVTDEKGTKYTYLPKWDSNASFKNKAYKNGLNYTNGKIELCFGMSSYGNHVYTLTYDVSNMIYNVDGAQVLYWKFINDSLDPAPKQFSINVSGPNPYKDSLDVWGYGSKSYAYVKDGIISMSSVEDHQFSSKEYAVLLVKYPSNTFNTTNTSYRYQTFNEVKKIADESTFKYDYDQVNKASYWICTIIILLSFGLPILIITKTYVKKEYVKKKIDKKNLHNFRDIPCKSDIFKAYSLSEIYDLNKKKEDLLGAVLLKWLKDKQISIVKQTKKTFFKEKEIVAIQLIDNPIISNPVEKELYDIMVTASEDMLLEENELKKWCKNNYSVFFKWFDKTFDSTIQTYNKEGHIQIIETKKWSKTITYTLDDSLYEEANKLAGLKQFLLEFSLIEEKQPIEVNLWEYYLIYAQIFGIADEVAKQFKKLYPELIEQSEISTNGLNYMDIMWINSLTSNSVSAASSARTAAQNYSAGGGGFSSGGGGGGSFGGGSGGGCR